MLSVAQLITLQLSIYEYVQHSHFFFGWGVLEPIHLGLFLSDCIALVSSIIQFDPMYLDDIIKGLGIKELGLLPNYE